MYLRRIKTLLLLIMGVTFLGPSCKKDKGTEEPSIQTKEIQGTITLPAGMPTDITGWTVSSNFSESQISGTSYQSKVSKDEVDIQFVSDAQGKEVLMGITYPGQTDFTISTSSTVLAILLKTPAVASLSSEGQVKLINMLKADSHFNEATEEIANVIKGGKGLLDTTNNQLFDKLGQLFQATSQKTTTGNENITIIPAGNTITFQNTGKPFVQVVGIYKDGTFRKKLVIDRYQYFAGSLSEIFTSILNPADPIQQTYEFEGDGNYEFKIRTGRPFSGDASIESDQAFEENLWNIVFDNVGHIIKALPVSLNEPCVKELRKWSGEEYLSIKSSLGQNMTAVGVSNVMLQFSVSMVNLIKTSSYCAGKPSTAFIEKVSKFLYILNPISKVSSAVSQTTFMYQWYKSPTVFDTCYKKTGTTLSPCNSIVGKWYFDRWLDWDTNVWTPYTNGEYVLFRSDLTWEMDEDGDNRFGTYNYNPSAKTISFTIGGSDPGNFILDQVEINTDTLFFRDPEDEASFYLHR